MPERLRRLIAHGGSSRRSGASDLGEAPRSLRGASPPRPGSARSRTPASPLDRPMGGGSRARLRVVGTPLTWRGRLLAACWAGGTHAVASHRGAAELWQLPGRDIESTEITCPRWRRARHDGLLVHESLVLDDIDTTTRERIPVTTVPRTLFDLAGVVGPTTVNIAVAAALRRNSQRWSTSKRSSLGWRVEDEQGQFIPAPCSSCIEQRPRRPKVRPSTSSCASSPSTASLLRIPNTRSVDLTAR